MSVRLAVRGQAVRTQRRAARPGASVWVSASAGTGKTKVLTDRALRLLLAGAAPTRLLCLTFTKAAAAEMGNRVSRTMGAWATIGDADLDKELTDLLGRAPGAEERGAARRLFARVLDAPGGMKIMTIHAFCQSVLRRFPLEAGVAPHFEVMDERDAAEALEEAKVELLARLRAGGGDTERALAEVTRNIHETGFPALIGALAGERGRLARLAREAGGLDGLVARIARFLGIGPDETVEGVVAAASADGAFDVEGLGRAAAALSKGSAADQRRGEAIAQWLAAGRNRGDGFDFYLGWFLTGELMPRKSLFTRGPAVALPQLPEILAAEQARLLAVVERRRKAKICQATAALLRLGLALLDAYAEKKAARARLDYDDLVLQTRRLLEQPGLAPWVLFKLDGGLDHILIDEAQDSNPDQWGVVRALAEEFFAGQEEGARPVARTVFAVGDVKQSIFGFQRADPAAFEAMRRHFRGRVEAWGHDWDDVPLEVSFRSTAAVLQAVDAVFASETTRRGMAEAPFTHLAERAGDAGLVELWPPLEPTAPPPAEAWKPPVERVAGDNPRGRLAALLARRIRDWLDRGETLEARGRAVEPGDIMVLVRRRGPFVEELVRALKDRGVPVAGVDRMVLGEQLAVMDLVALGQFLLLPEDDLTLATVLKGPLIGLREEELFDLAHGREGSLWRVLTRRADGSPVYAHAHAWLAVLRGRVDFARPFELYAELLNRGGRRRLLERLGPEADDPIDEFLALALAYERTNTPSLQGFLYWLAAGKAEVKRDLEQGRGAVRVMTVHGAKGLQAPIVILPDTMQVPRPTGPTLLWPEGGELVLWPPYKGDCDEAAAAAWTAADAVRDDEYRRLLYVAMTRAEDRLYVCGWRTRQGVPAGCWYNLVRDALTPVAAEFEEPFLAASAGPESAKVLRLTSAQRAAAPAPSEAPAPAEEPLPDWAGSPPPPEPAPPRPLAPSRPAGDEPTVRSPLGPDQGRRFRRGRLIHRLLQTLPDLPPAAREDACLRFLARAVHALTPDERAEIMAEVLAVLAQPAFAPLFGPGSRAEVPIVGALGDGAPVISGQVDRLVVDGADVWIVDYKSDRPPPSTVEETPPIYLRQMAAYRALLARLYPEKTISCALLWTDGPRLMRLDGGLLDAHAPGRPGAGSA